MKTSRRERERAACERVIDALFADIDAVRVALEGRQPLSDRKVHDVRKALKHARACVRLLRAFLGKRGYARCNVALRDAARPLSAVRDASVLVATLDQLITRGDADPFLREARRFRSALVAERTRLRGRLTPSKTSLVAVHACLRRLEAEASAWDVHGGTLELETALVRVYGRGRRALAALEREHSDERLHELRKQSKYLWNALAVIEPKSKTRMHKLVTRAHELADALGDDHDLATLRDKADAPGGLEPGALRALERAIAQRRKRLQRRALARAARLYDKRPKAFAARVLWEGGNPRGET